MSRLLVAAQLLLLIALVWPKSASIPADWGTGIGLSLLYLAVTLAVAAWWALRWKLSVMPEPMPGVELATQGPYRFMRHPMYAAVLAGALGWCLIYRHPINLLALGALVAVLLFKIRHEESLLVQRYPEYQRYRQRVKALIPGLY